MVLAPLRLRAETIEHTRTSTRTSFSWYYEFLSSAEMMKVVLPDGREAVATPEFEALNDILEVRIPALERLDEKQKEKIALLETTVSTASAALALSESIKADVEEIKTAWKDAAVALQPSFWDHLVDALVYVGIFLGGAVVGSVVGYAIGATQGD